jgi:hypothetical protein
VAQVVAAFRERFNKDSPRRATLLGWEKRVFAVGCVKDSIALAKHCLLKYILAQHSIRNVVFWSKENPNFMQKLEHNPTHVMIWTFNQGVRK